jgi:general secretion pathway protein K
MNTKAYTNNRGVALLVTLAVITVVVAGALEINRRARSEAVVATASGERFILSRMAASGIHLAMALLVKDRRDSDIDSVQETWARTRTVEAYVDAFPFEEGEVTVTIEDERGKIQVNALVDYPRGRQVNPTQYRVWMRLARRLASETELPEDSDPAVLVNSLIDWLDRGDDDAVTGLGGAESEHYQSLTPPYSSRNGPIPHLGELALVQGFTPELLEAAGGIDGISRYLTVYGLNPITAPGAGGYDGRININTAGLPVLAAILPDTRGHLAPAIADYREATADNVYRHSLLQPDWYRQVPGADGLSIDPALITLSSDLFRISATASRRDRVFTATAVVRREKDEKTGRWNCKVLQWEEE